MYNLRRVFSDHILLITAILLLFITLIASCDRKKDANSSYSADAASQELRTVEAGKNSSQPVPSEGAKPAGEAPQGVAQKINLPRLVDLGADKCIPCKMMAPILKELKQEYAGKLEVEVIDVWKDPGAGRHYGIHVIPTQIFYDSDGKEFNRHVGYISKEDILAVFQQKGIKLDG